jgi:hypothetical protein
MRLISFWVVVAAFAVGLAGCSKKRPNLVEVKGTLTLRGEPFPNVTLTFVPETEPGQFCPSSTGVTDVDGHYTLFCGAVGKQGALVGGHHVVVIDPESLEPPPGGPEPREAEELPSPSVEKQKSGVLRYSANYMVPHKTPLHVEVKAPGPQVIDLNVE